MDLRQINELDEYEIEAIYRFNNKFMVSDSGCWEWTGAKDGRGYGRIYYKQDLVGAHQFSYCHFVGDILPGQCVCHHCDNPPCCNPNHLFLGTVADNIHDMMQKGRMRTNEPHSVGEDNPKAKLFEKNIPVIRQMFVPYKMSCNKIAKLYNVNVSTIQRIIYHNTWKHI